MGILRALRSNDMDTGNFLPVDDTKLATGKGFKRSAAVTTTTINESTIYYLVTKPKRQGL